MTAPTTAVPTSGPPATAAQVQALAPGYSDAAANGAISWALTQVESYCERRFAQQNSTCTVTAHGGRALLDDPPVTAVTAVQAFVGYPYGSAPSWQTLDVSGVGWDADGDIWDARPYRGNGIPWPTTPRGLKVTYTHGFDNWPQPVIDTVVALAAAYIVNPTGMSERRVLDTTYRWAPGVGAAGILDPLAGLSRYVLRGAS